MSTALILCDLWNRHWCESADAGTDRIARAAAPFVRRFRAEGGQVIHAPSETMGFYIDHPARQYVLGLTPASPPQQRPVGAPALDGPARGYCPDVPQCVDPAPVWPWKSQHAAIEVQSDDAVLDSGSELWAVVADRGVDRVFIAGVHTNLCVLDRPFGIKALVERGLDCLVIADLTEAMPADYTTTTLDYIRDYWCPTSSSAEVSP